MNNIKNKTMFIGIGAQKTGTTWLADYLSAHPQVCFSPLKELHFFDQKYFTHKTLKNFIKRFHNSVKGINENSNESKFLQAHMLLKRIEMGTNTNAYMQYFDDLVKDEKVFGEITPSYSMLDSDAFKEMNELHPNVKIIFILRHPIDRFWSQIRFQARSKDSFDPQKEFNAHINHKGFVLRTDYKRTIEALSNVVDEKNICYIFYEDLFSSEKGEKTVKKITDFLEIDYIKPDLGKVINVSRTLDLDDDLYKKASNKFNYVIEYINKFFNGEVPDNWKNVR